MKRIATAILTLAALSCAAPSLAAEHIVQLNGTTFTPSQLTINAGDTVTWRNMGGFHNVVADDGSFRSGNATSALFSFSRVFDTVGDFRYFCDVHGSAGGLGMAGRISVSPVAASFVINEGVQGSWFNPDFSAQGFFFDVAPSINLFGIAWFTWTTTPGQYDWLTGAGPYANGVANITFTRTRGGVFNAAANVVATTAGTGTVTFIDCSHATLQFTLTDPPATGTIPLRRLLETSSLCTTANPGGSGAP
jgi:plastocyanin